MHRGSGGGAKFSYEPARTRVDTVSIKISDAILSLGEMTFVVDDLEWPSFVMVVVVVVCG